MRFPLVAAMACLVLVAIGLVALREPSDWWASVAFSFMLVVLGSMLLAALFHPGPGRPFWSGAAIVGWGYAALAFAPGLEASVRPLLVSTRLLQDGGLIAFGQLAGVRASYFETAGHAMIAMAVAVAGGAVARSMARGRGGPEVDGARKEGPSRAD